MGPSGLRIASHTRRCLHNSAGMLRLYILTAVSWPLLVNTAGVSGLVHWTVLPCLSLRLSTSVKLGSKVTAQATERLLICQNLSSAFSSDATITGMELATSETAAREPDSRTEPTMVVAGLGPA